jgi:CBS domain containing-hemolysin-like protein
MIIYAGLIVLFLGLSAFFSGMEAAIFSLSRFRVKTLIYEERKGSQILGQLKKEPGKTLAAILLANLLVNVAASSVGAIILIQLSANSSLNTTLTFIIEFILMTSLLLIFGEITPKIVAFSHAESLSLKFGNIIKIISRIFLPVSSLMMLFTKFILSRQPPEEHTTISDKEIKIMLSEAKKFKVLDEGEEKFGYQILRFGKIRVSDIMTPRHKVIGVSINASIEEVRKKMISEKHSRICVFNKKHDVIGILFAKHVFVSQLNKKDINRQQTIRDLMRDPYIVPETKLIDNLLSELRQNGIHISVVVDEFGGFSGIVTLEDILESLFGEIIDEYDEIADFPYKKISANRYVFHGDISIGELSRILDVESFADEGERLSGYILNHFGRIPNEKESFVVNNLKIEITEIRDRIIEQVSIERDIS